MIHPGSAISRKWKTQVQDLIIQGRVRKNYVDCLLLYRAVEPSSCVSACAQAAWKRVWTAFASVVFPCFSKD